MVDLALPFASTYSSMITVPLDSSAEIMERKIRTALPFAANIERDHELNPGELMSLA
jgi:hypothetical protein